MNTKSLFLFFLFGAFATLSQAQNNSLGKNDPDAKKVLDGLSAKLKSFKAVQCGFTLTITDAKDKVQGSKSGTVQIRGNKYHINVVGGQDIFCDGKDIWTYDKGTNEVQITKYDPSNQTISPEKIFTDFYDKDFLYILNGESKIGARTVQEVELTPTDKTKPFFKALLYVDKTQHTLASIKWFDKSGSKYTLTTKNLNGNAAITDAQLAYNKAKFPGAEEVDLRN
ncbi:MAG TPA: outer membrane lipoprotein carrier protein LolA [Puia sp.]|nr:outer membrane lipoprotein carrier protein LolA [Puia sp.]